jgi:hypothetical protein
VLIVWGTQVPRSELACCRVRWDDMLMAELLSSAALRLRADRLRVSLASVFAWHGELVPHAS